MNGSVALRLLSPTTLEIAAIVAGPATAASTELPPPPLAKSDFTVTAGGTKYRVRDIGFRRRVAYAPLKNRDLRVGHYIYIRVNQPIAEDETVAVTYTGDLLWLQGARLQTKADPLRHSAAIHTNHVGYLPSATKVGMVGYYLGTLGELQLPAATSERKDSAFQIIDARTGSVVHRGELKRRPHIGMPRGWYQNVWAADFTEFEIPGEYRLAVAGMGASHPFLIHDGVAAAFARTYALGFYHQRCGGANGLPFTPFVHGPCHTAPAEIPTKAVTALPGFPAEPRDANLYPYVRQGKVDVSGGHHDAGDYSKYTINSTGLIHMLMFSVDAFAGVAHLDNLGLPESGDGRSDVLQIAKWEADFLAKMQDEDGGFYFLVYPRDRRYEGDVLPDRGDPQIVWPKNTAATAAAVAALAQCASSPAMRKAYPQDAAHYLATARRGWKFLRDAEARHGRGQTYRKFTHYGDLFEDQDEIAWAACELFLATGEEAFGRELEARLNPRDPATRRWGWRRLTDAYGHAIRSYAFGARTGRVPPEKLHARLLRQCEDEIIACAEDWWKAARDSAYGTSYPEPTMRVLGGGWYFSTDQAFDLAVACQLDFPERNDRRPDYRDAIISNLNYDAGCNPLNLSFITGLGWQRPLEIVHHYAQNDRRALPPPGIPLGSIQDGFFWVGTYKGELGALSYPLDGGKQLAYPILDRWGDTFNVQTEFVVLNQARALAIAAWLMAQSPLRAQPWKSGRAEILGLPNSVSLHKDIHLTLKLPDDLNDPNTRITWEARDHDPVIGPAFTLRPKSPGRHWIEAEALLPDGRRFFAGAEFSANSPVIFWIAGSLPRGAQPLTTGGDTWTWSPPKSKPDELARSMYAATPQHESAGRTPLHEHGFNYAEDTLAVEKGDVLFAYVFIDPENPPKEIMLNWNDGSWEHRAYWGQSLIKYGNEGTAGQRPMGPMPKPGRWARLEVPASAVGLEGRTVQGMTFSLHGGRAIWDVAGKMSASTKRLGRFPVPPPLEEHPPAGQ